MAAKENNMSIPFDRIWHIPENDQEHAEIAAREALASVPIPNILLCMSDINALAASRVCQEMGIRIPEDIVLTGFDDIPEASRAAPSLTTICQQSIEKGKVAANLLLEAIAKGDDDEENIQHIMLGTRLIVRNSCP
jgi:DNA-binding LacI/PurR family transcriptional regulator